MIPAWKYSFTISTNFDLSDIFNLFRLQYINNSERPHLGLATDLMRSIGGD